MAWVLCCLFLLVVSWLTVTLRLRGKNAKKPDNLLRYVMSIVSKTDIGRVLSVYILSFSIMNYVSIWSIAQKRRQQKRKEKHDKKKAEKKIIMRESMHTHTHTFFRKRKYHSRSQSHAHISIKTLIDFRLSREQTETTNRRSRKNDDNDENEKTHTRSTAACRNMLKMQQQIWM